MGDASGLLAAVANAGPLLLNQKYSRDFEREADAEGVALLKRARIDPCGMTDFFRTILEEEKKQMEKITDERARAAMDTAMVYFGSHPETEERIRRLAALDAAPEAPVRHAPLVIVEQPSFSLVGYGPGDMRPRYRWPGLWF